MNLILAVILDKAMDHKKEIEEEKRIFSEATKKFCLFCKDMDVDGSGTISLEELLAGFDSNVDFQATLGQMNINKQDLEYIFGLMDLNEEGCVSYSMFSKHLTSFRTSDTEESIAIIRLELSHL